jgi:hypothetical protein
MLRQLCARHATAMTALHAAIRLQVARAQQAPRRILRAADGVLRREYEARRTTWPRCCAAPCADAPDQPGLTAMMPTQSYLIRRGATAVFNSRRHARAAEWRTAGCAPPSWSKMRCSIAM